MKGSWNWNWNLIRNLLSCLMLFSFENLITPSLTLVLPDVSEDWTNFTVEPSVANDEQRLMRRIFWQYDPSVRPVINATETVQVAIGLTLTHIFNIDEKKQVLSTNVWLEHEWLDERVYWNYSEFGGLNQLTLPARFVWLPDIVLYNNAEDSSQGIMQTNVALYPSGTLLWAPPVKLRSTCKLDVTFFPFDEQICHLRFGSWIYDGLQVDVTNRSETIRLDSYTDNGEWRIVQTAVRRKYSCCENVPFPELRFTIHLRRRTLFYLYNVIIPCLMLSTLTLMQFWLPCESGEKVTLGLTVLLAYSVFSFKIAENMPETSDVIPLIAIYVMCIMGISSLSVTLSVLVLNLRHSGERKRTVPRWLQFLAYTILAPLVGEGDRFGKVKHNMSQMERRAMGRSYRRVAHFVRRYRTNTTSVAGTSGMAAMMVGAPLELTSFLPSSHPLSVDADSMKMDDEEIDGGQTSALERIVRRTGILMKKFEQEKYDEYMVGEWKRVARIFDQFFFWLVFTVTVFVTVAMLIVAPYYSRRLIAAEL